MRKMRAAPMDPRTRSALLGGVVLLAIAVVLLPAVAATLTCTFNASVSCGSATKYLGLENDTGGYTNAHAQNHSLGTYANSLCCSTDLADTLGRECTDDTLLRLSDEDNAHAQNDSVGTYPVDVCISLSLSNVSCVYVNGACGGNSTCVLSLSDHDNAHVGQCGDYSISVCCTELNGPPTMPTLLVPENGNGSVQERFTWFDWTASTDPQGDPIHYRINITPSAGCAVDPPTRNVSGASEYTSVEELCVDSSYNWTVRACDDQGACSPWHASWNFTVQSTLSISFTSNSTDFGDLQPSTLDQTVANDTLDDAPGPLVVRADGNVDVNIDVQALDALWDNAGLNTSYFQYADENSSAWRNFSTAYQDYYDGLSWNASREMEIAIEVPLQEPPGTKRSTVRALAESAE